MKSLSDYAKLVTGSCQWCGRSLVGKPVNYRKHETGWEVEGFVDKLWLSVHCDCDYDWSLNKLGIPRIKYNFVILEKVQIQNENSNWYF